MGRPAALRTGVIETAVQRTAGARVRGELAMMQGGPVDGEILEVRAVLTGHGDGPRVRRSANVWQIDTGADFPTGKLTIAQIDTDPMKFTTVRASDHAPRKPETLGQVLGGRRQREGGDKSMTGARELGARAETEQANAALVVLIECERSGRSTEAVAHEWASQMCEAARAGDEKSQVYDALADEAIVRAACEEGGGAPGEREERARERADAGGDDVRASTGGPRRDRTAAQRGEVGKQRRGEGTRGARAREGTRAARRTGVGGARTTRPPRARGGNARADSARPLA